MQLDVFTLFPEAFDWFAGQRHMANLERHGTHLAAIDYRAHTPLKGGRVDDAPYGGGAGMVIRVDVIEAALRAHYGIDPLELRRRRRVIALSASGRQLDEPLVQELAREQALTLICGRYEGFDERIVEHLCSDAISIGRYVLSGGELPAMVLCDAITRKLPGALGDPSSALEESFSGALAGNPEYPQYTRPPVFRGWAVPEILLSGDHQRIREWRLRRSRERA